jgi:phosphoadenosine phosphosulfate reductase
MNEHWAADARSHPTGGPADAGPPDLAEPYEVLQWACSTLDRLAVASSFQGSGLVILHMTRAIRPEVPVLFLNTGFHFPETLEFRDRIAGMWNLNLVELRGEHETPEGQSRRYGDGLYRMNPDHCCRINKVEPLQKALESYDGWISGVRRDQSPERAAARMVQTQLLPSGKAVAKIHPLAHWTQRDVDSYLSEHGIPTHPLLEQGYTSIGCAPCTKPVQHGHGREGRWADSSKSECGIHTFGGLSAP